MRSATRGKEHGAMRLLRRAVLLATCVLLACFMGLSSVAYAVEPSFDGDASRLTDKNWMSGISGDRLLSDIVLPGSSGAATSQLFLPGQASSGDWVPSRATAQDTPIATQLTSGVRIFDLHLTNTDPGTGWSGAKDTLWVAEQVEMDGKKVLYYAQDANGNAISFKRAINYMRSFLSKNPSETVVVTLSEADDAAAVFRQLRGELDDYDKYLYLGSDMPRLKDVRGKVVVCTTRPELLGENGGMAFPESSRTESVSIGGTSFSATQVSNGADAWALTCDDHVPLTGDAHAGHSSVVFAGKTSSAAGESTPRQHANEVNPVLFATDGPFSEVGKLYGWVLANFMGSTEAHRLWVSNYPDGLEYHTLTYKTREPSEQTVTETHVLKGASAYGPACNVDVPGKSFGGWSFENNDLAYETDEAIPVSGDATLWASWTTSWASLASWLSKRGSTPVSLTLERDLYATVLDGALCVPAGADVTIVIGNHTLDRGLAGKNSTGVEGGSVFTLGAGAKLTLVGGAAPQINNQFVGHITGGHTSGLGGGILMGSGSVLVLDSVRVMGNVANQEGGGIYVPEGATLKVGGKTCVTDNTSAAASSARPSNVFLGEGALVEVGVNGKALESSNATKALIGVTTYKKPTKGATVPISTTLGEYASVANFQSDDESYRVGEVGGAAVLSTGVTVRFNSMGGTPVSDQVVAEGAHVMEPSAPVKYDNKRLGVDALSGEYVLRGWYTDSSCADDKRWDFENGVVTAEMLDEGLTLYAKWGVRYTFDPAGGGAPQSTDPNHPMSYDPGDKVYYIDLDFGEKLSSAPTSTRDGWRLAGWAYSTFKGDGIGKLFKFNETEAATSLALIARWGKPRESYTVTFNPCNGDLPTQTQVEHGKGVAKPTPDPSRTGFSFAGWYTSTNYTLEWNFDSYTVSNDVTLYAKWNPITCTVSFDADGGTPVSSEAKVSYGDKVEKPDDPTREGFVFEGWHVVRDSGGGSSTVDQQPYDFETSVTANLALRAVWVQKETEKHTVIFNTNGGSTVDPQQVEEGGTVTKPADPTFDTYHEFGGWFKDEACTVPWSFGPDPVADTVTSDVTLHAKWMTATHTVTFKDSEGEGGSELGSQTVDHGGCVDKPVDPVKDGFVFLYWYQAWDGGTKAPYGFTAPVVDDLDLYAAWEEVPSVYCVVFDSNGGSDVHEQMVAKGGVAEQPLDPERAGCRFDGWYLANSSNPYDFSTPVTDNITLTAHWIESASTFHTVTFDTNGGKPETIGAQDVNDGACAIAPANPTLGGHDFDGWYVLIGDDEVRAMVEADESLVQTARYDGNDVYMPYDFSTPVIGDVDLRAWWRPKTFMVSFDTQGGSELSPVVRSYGEMVGEVPTPIYEGKSFLWWTDGPDSLTHYPSLANVRVEGNVTFYANWANAVDLPMTVTFDPNDGGKTAPTSETVQVFMPVARPGDPTFEGHEFDDWWEVLSFVTPDQLSMIMALHPEYESSIRFDENDTVLRRYNFGAPVMYDNLELRAQWTAKSHKVTFMSGDEVMDEQEVEWGKQATRPQDPFRYGYVFDGWCTDESLAKPYDFDAGVAGDLTLHAKFSVAKHTVTFDVAGGSAVGEQRVEHAGHATEPAASTREGYTFQGWFLEGESDPFDFQNTQVVGDFTLVAHWKNNDVPGSDPNPDGDSDSPDQDTHGVHTTIVNGEGAPVISQREGSLDAVMRTMFEREVAEQDVYVTLSSSSLQADGLDATEKSLVQARLSALGAQAGVWFDLSLAKRVGDEQAEPSSISSTDQPIKLEVAVPESLRTGAAGVARTYYVLRLHDGYVDVLASGTGRALDFESDRYSTYVIAYTGPSVGGASDQGGQSGQEAQVGQEGQTTAGFTTVTSGGTSRQAAPGTGDTTSGVAIVALIALACIALGWVQKGHPPL